MAISRNVAIAIGIVVVLIIIAAAYILTRPSEVAPTPTTPTTTTPTTPPPTARVTLKVIGPWSGKEAEYFLKVLDEYKRLNPNVDFEYTTMRAEDLAKTLPLQLEARTSPADVLITPWGWFIVEMAGKGHVEDLTTVIRENEYVAGVLDSVKWDGKVWAAPFTMWLKPGFWYRKSFFQAHGLQEPKTWDEFVALLDKIKGISGVKNPIVTGDDVGWPMSDVTEHFIIALGGPQLQYDLISGKAKFTDANVVAIFERLASLIKNGYFSQPIEWTTAVELWWKGEYALYFMGTWITGMVENPDDLAFFPLPGARGIVGGTDYIFVPKYAQHKEEALKFVEWLATEGQVVHASTPAGKIPTWLKASPEKLWGPMQGVFSKVRELNLAILPDMDDTIGGEWQRLFWDQLKLLWANPDKLPDILATLAREHPATKG